ncbi:MAG: TonB family protein [Gammaproteobacteria bacterium]
MTAISIILLLAACTSLSLPQSGGEATTFQNLLPSAEKGDLEAQDDVGYMYETGEGAPLDYQQAVIWYRRAADQGYAPSERHLGYMYGEGLGVQQDYGQAVIWYQRAAQQGDAWAENNMGYLYETGFGVPKDYSLALVWYTRAATQRNPAAEVNLGNMYLSGLGTKQDYAAAMQWYTVAAIHGYFQAQLRLGTLYAYGWGVEKDEGQAAYWFGKAAARKFKTAADFESALRDIVDAHKAYPRSAIKAGVTGTVVVGFTYLDGKAIKAYIEQSSGHKILDQAALHAVNESLFPPLPTEPIKDKIFEIAVKYSPVGSP